MKTDWNQYKQTKKGCYCGLLAHSNYEDGLKHLLLMDSKICFWSFGAFQLWRRIETKSLDKGKRTFSIFWRIPIMKTDWNDAMPKALRCNNLAFGAFQLWRRIETLFWPLWSQYRHLLLAHSNYEDGLKQVLIWINEFFYCIFWRIPIMKTDWNILG